MIESPSQYPNKWTFKTWLANFKEVDLPIGDLAKDILGDEEFPDDDYFGDILDHLQSRRACPEAIETFSTVWNFYLASK